LILSSVTSINKLPGFYLGDGCHVKISRSVGKEKLLSQNQKEKLEQEMHMVFSFPPSTLQVYSSLYDRSINEHA